MMRLLLLILPVTLDAEFLRIEMGFGGMECASCTDFLETRFARNRHVKSVAVDRQKGILTLELKPENKLRLEQVRDQVQQGGFTPRQTRVVVRGVAEAGGLQVSGLDQTLAASDEKLRAHASKRVRVEGEVKPGAAGGNPTLEVTKVDPDE